MIQLKRNDFSTFLDLFKQNPTIGSFALSGILRAHNPWFKGHAQISDRGEYKFSSNKEEESPTKVKVLYISPYSGFWSDLLVSIKRIFTGVLFNTPSTSNDLQSHFAEGRRITIFFTSDRSRIEAFAEKNQEPLFSRIYKTVFSC